MIKLIGYDLDDTLIQTAKPSIANVQDAAGKCGLEEKTEEEMLKYYVKTSNWDNWIKILYLNINIKEFREFYNSQDYPTIFPVVDGALDTITSLSMFTQGIITSRTSGKLYRRLREAGLNKDLFQFIMSEDDLKFKKPDPKVFDQVKNIAKNLGIQEDEMLYIGDSVNDFKASSGAGIHFVGVLTGPTTQEMFLYNSVSPENIIPSVAGLPTYVKNKYLIEEVVR